MIDLRLWRFALLAVPVALVIAMFSLEEVPQPLEPPIPPDAFDGEAATGLAKELAAAYPEPSPGSDDDAELAELVLSRFSAIGGAEVSEQRFDASIDGEDVELRNLILVLPGASERQVVLLAHRDSREGSGAASSLASTAAMLEIASGFTGATHRKTLVFVSTDGGSAGALGARRFVRDYSDAGLIDGTVVLSQPAVADPSPPLVIPWSNGADSTGIELARTAGETVSAQVDEPAGDAGPLEELFRLALPGSFGEQGALIEGGIDSVRLSSSGELPLPASLDEPGEISAETVDRFGRSTLSLLLALDAKAERLEPGPPVYVGLAGNLLPGWTLALLALALLAPVALVAFGGVAVAAHSPLDAARGLGWAALRVAPFLGALLVIYATALIGLLPAPEFPFLRAEQEPGLAGGVSMGLSLAVLGAAAFLLRPLLPPPERLWELAAPAALSLAVIAAFGVWLLNPYLALLVAIGLQAWVVAAARPALGRLRAAGIVAAGLIPVLAATADLAVRFDAGPGVGWDLLLMFTGGQLGDRLVLLGCLLAGAGLAIVAANATGPAPPGEAFGLRALIARGEAVEAKRAARRERRGGRARRSRRGRGGRGGRRAPRIPPPEQEDSSKPPAEPEPPGPDQPPRDEPPPQAEPDRDPRMWSKPEASTSRPAASTARTPLPSLTEPISASP